MNVTVNGISSFVSTGGRDFDPSLPSVVLIHGAFAVAVRDVAPAT